MPIFAMPIKNPINFNIPIYNTEHIVLVYRGMLAFLAKKLDVVLVEFGSVLLIEVLMEQAFVKDGFVVKENEFVIKFFFGAVIINPSGHQNIFIPIRKQPQVLYFEIRWQRTLTSLRSNIHKLFQWLPIRPKLTGVHLFHFLFLFLILSRRRYHIHQASLFLLGLLFVFEIIIQANLFTAELFNVVF